MNVPSSLIDTIERSGSSSSSSGTSSSLNSRGLNSNILHTPVRSDDSDDSHNSRENSGNSKGKMMQPPQTAREFVQTANQMIGYKYGGDLNSLESFLDAISLLQTLVEPQNEDIFLKFVLTRLVGSAREEFPEDPESVDDIVDALRDKIKHESSKVIEGRIMALRTDRMSLTKFAERAEELAKEFKRSLVFEGFTKKKAQEITIEKTIEMCRKSAKSDTVKAILAASKFENPNEVVAKMIVEINNAKQDKAESSNFRQNNQNRNGRGNYRGRGGHNGNYNRNNNNDNRGGHNGNRGGYRGRGGYNRNRNYNNNNNNNGNNGNEHTIRVITGNGQSPSPNDGQPQQQQQQSQQFPVLN
ncbi:putative uncharacterized protein DDB_G0278921 [Sitodiplosis mosellana]|uniref:putative uncharacterized protein DDB_G0278921 n=1 Tax=Sitodiplosis mosellana TaxID=263140 RepID=UPI002444C553|nr:putative uncharacterized protein DDB_G0278921 [Sitodiplosis mosellana]